MEPEPPNSVASNGGSNSSNLAPVAPEQSGEGLPYAPENFPNPGDIWRWKSGKRISNNGNYRDRYLYVPHRLAANRSSIIFKSKLSVERYVKEKFPDVNITEFFDSFTWSIPSGLPGNMNPRGNTNPLGDDSLLKQFELEEEAESDLLCDIDGCKAGNSTCSSLILEKEHSPIMPCDLCCAAPNFCRECCCILCYKTLDPAYGGYSYIMCKVTQGNTFCGHAAHLECALRSYMAGTVEEPIGLDAEYLCRRCDGRTELISHANELLLTCEAIDSNNDIKEKILHLGLCLLCNSQKATAKELMSHFALALSKLKDGTNTEDILKAYTNLTAAHSPGSNNGNAAMDTSDDESPLNVKKGTKSFRYHSEVLKLDAEFDQTMEAFKKSQKYELKVAEETLREQLKHLNNLSKQLEKDKSELANQPNASHSSVLFQTVKKGEEQLRQEVMKLEEMKKIAKGCARTSEDVLKLFDF